MSEKERYPKERLSWRERRASKRLAEMAMREAQEVIDTTPEARILRSAHNALELAYKHKADIAIINHYSIADEWFSERSRTAAKKQIRTLSIEGTEIGLEKNYSIGFVATLERSWLRTADLFMGDKSDQLYVATYDDHSVSGAVSQITPEILAEMDPYELEVLATVSELIEAAERQAYTRR